MGHDTRRDDPIAGFQARTEAARDTEADDRRGASKHGFLDRVRPQLHVASAREYAHSRRSADPGFRSQPGDDDQKTTPADFGRSPNRTYPNRANKRTTRTRASRRALNGKSEP